MDQQTPFNDFVAAFTSFEAKAAFEAGQPAPTLPDTLDFDAIADSVTRNWVNQALGLWKEISARFSLRELDQRQELDELRNLNAWLNQRAKNLPNDEAAAIRDPLAALTRQRTDLLTQSLHNSTVLTQFDLHLDTHEPLRVSIEKPRKNDRQIHDQP